LKQEILSIIDKDENDFDVKEGRIKALDGGKAYATLLQDCYPALRHSDYTVRYVVRGFNVEEAKQIIKTRPQQLSLQEMYLVAQTYKKGSNEFNEVFDVAVRMFPDDPTANINAAAIELQRGDLQQAARYLEKADAQASATLNNRGVLKLLQGASMKLKPISSRRRALVLPRLAPTWKRLPISVKMKQYLENNFL